VKLGFLRRALVAVAVAVGAVLTLAPAAFGQSATVGIEGGTTTLSISSSAANALADNGFGVSRIRPATTSGQTTFNFPITGGDVNPTNGVGVVNHSGGLAIQSADSSRTLRLRNFIANTNTLRLSGQVGSSRTRVNFGRISPANAKVIRRGPGMIGTYIVRARLIITPAGSVAINGFFGRSVPLAGLDLGRIDIRINPSEVLLDGGTTTLTPTNELLPTLQSAGITLGNVPPAAADTAGRLNFPIDGGEWVIDPGLDALGDIQHSGGISLTGAGGSPQVALTNFDLNSDVDTGPRILAQVNGGDPTQVLNPVFENGRIGVSNGFLVINNIPASLTDAARDLLNQTFGSSLPSGTGVGTFRVKGNVV